MDTGPDKLSAQDGEYDLDPTLQSHPVIKSPLLSMWALFCGVALLMLGNGLSGTLLGVRASRENFDTTAIGVIQAAYYAGFLAGSKYTMRALGKVGHVRVFAALASTASTAVLLHSLYINPVSWFAMRFVTGFCMAGLYVVAESWLNEMATPETRGRTLSIYMVVTMAGVTGGQFLLNVADPNSFELFVLASVLVSMALVPMALSESAAPQIARPEKLNFKTLLAVVPTGVVTMFFSGAAAGSIFAFSPVYGNEIGMSNAEISAFLSAAMIGAALLQLPIGTLSDRVSRRGVMLGVAFGATLGALYGTTTTTGYTAWIAMFIIGGTSFSLYSLAIAYTNDWIEPEQRVGASANLVMVNGVGAVCGPLISSTAMALTSPRSFFWVVAATHAIIGFYLLARIIARDPIPVEDQTEFQPIAARSSTVITLIGRIRGRDTRSTFVDAPPPDPDWSLFDTVEEEEMSDPENLV